MLAKPNVINSLSHHFKSEMVFIYVWFLIWPKGGNDDGLNASSLAKRQLKLKGL